jgi:pimeloyl-ACP methyl ester carboxylesterase
MLPMASPLRILGKASFLLLVLGLLVVGFVLAWFASWRSDELALLDSASEIAETKKGRIEYVDRGEGPTLLVFHDAPGGYDQAMLLGSLFAEEEFHLVAPSRPGYLRTPLTTGRSLAEQADAMAALLETMGISRVAVLASSFGAPAAIHFAGRYPDKVWALVLLSPAAEISAPDEKRLRIDLGQLVDDRLKGDFGAWLALETLQKDPRKLLVGIVQAENDATQAEREALVEFVLEESEQREWFESLIETFVPPSAREAGVRNDLQQLRTLSEFPLEQIVVPTLIVHGSADKLIPIEGSEAMAARIPGSIFHRVDGAGHLVELGPKAAEVRSKVLEFLREHSVAQLRAEDEGGS